MKELILHSLNSALVFCILVLILLNHCKEVIGQIQPRMIDREEAQVGEFPHHVLIHFDKGERHGGSQNIICGASIINEEFILVAAHCVQSLEDKFKQIEIYIKVIDIRFILQSPSGQNSRIPIRVRNLFLHRCYQRSRSTGGFPRFYNDIALIQTDSLIPINNKTVKAIPIDTENLALSGTVVTAIGWGCTVGKGMENISQSPILQKAKLTINGGWCEDEESLEKFSAASQICAFDDMEFICKGDSGGPLLCKNKNGLHVLCGITSIQIYEDEKPCTGVGIFTRVYHYRNWIKGIIEGMLGKNTQEDCFRENDLPTKKPRTLRGQQKHPEERSRSRSDSLFSQQSHQIIYGIYLIGIFFSYYSRTMF